MINHFGLEPFRRYVFLLFTGRDGDEDTLSANQFKAMADYAGLRSDAIALTSQSVDRNKFNRLVVKADRNLQDGYLTLGDNVRNMEIIFEHFAGPGEEYMSIAQFNECLRVLGLDPIKGNSFGPFIVQNKLHSDGYNDTSQGMSLKGFREFLFKLVDLETFEKLKAYYENIDHD